jgi:hypothetical protein
VRPRKGVVSLRICSSSSQDSSISFEFHIQQKETLMRVVHSIKAADANAVSAVASKHNCSEIVAAPKVLAKLLDPLKRTVETAVIIGHENVSAASFHHTDTTGTSSHRQTDNNAILQATSAALFKTETGIACDEFEEFYLRDNRATDDEENEQDMPPGVNEQVVLVFPIKEAKAMLSFCSQSILDQELLVTVSFHYGGKPILFETSAESFTAELVLATLDHKLLQNLQPTTSTSTGAARGGNNSAAARGNS